MDFEHTDKPVVSSHSTVQLETEDKSLTSDAAVRNIGSGDASAPMEFKGDDIVAVGKEEYAEDLLDLKPPQLDAEIPNFMSVPGGLASGQQLQSNPFESLSPNSPDTKISKPEEKDVSPISGRDESAPQFPSGSPTGITRHHDDLTEGDDQISSAYPDRDQGRNEDGAALPVRVTLPSDYLSESPERSISPVLDHDSGVPEPCNPTAEQGVGGYLGEPALLDDDSPSRDIPTHPIVTLIPELALGTTNAPVPVPDKADLLSETPAGSLRDDPPSTVQHPSTLTFDHVDPLIVPEDAAPTLPKAETPIDLEPAPSSSSPPFPSPHTPSPPQGRPPLEPAEPADKPTGLPSISSMEVEPPTPTLHALPDEELPELGLDALRARIGRETPQEAIIPPAPDKPLPPTPGDKSLPPTPGDKSLPPTLGGDSSRHRGAKVCLSVGKIAGILRYLWQRGRNDPRVMEILLWRDPKKSGAALVTGLVVLVSMLYFSFISVVAYLSLALLTVTLGFRLYKTVLGAVQKSGDGHPFQDLLSVDTKVSTEKGHEMADKVVSELNCCSGCLKDLFLVKDIFESFKFGFALYLLTYVGAIFNTMTLVIMTYVAAFTLPKVYEQNKAQIDQVLGQVKDKVGDISTKVKAAIPMGKKAEVEPVTEEKKEE